MKIKKGKLSQSQVVASILLILIVIAAVVVVLTFVIPFVKEQLSGSDCLTVANSQAVEIVNDIKYTCYNSTAKNMSIKIHIGDIEELIDGFVVELSGADSKSFELTIDNPDNILMYSGGVFQLPGKNEERTYIIENIEEKPESVSVSTILKNGKTCETSDVLETVNECFNPYS